MTFRNREHTLPLRRLFADVFLILLRAALASKGKVRIFEGVEAAIGTAVVDFVLVVSCCRRVAERVGVFELAFSGVTRLGPRTTSKGDLVRSSFPSLRQL